MSLNDDERRTVVHLQLEKAHLKSTFTEGETTEHKNQRTRCKFADD